MKTTAEIPYYAHEGQMSRMERIVKRQTLASAVCAVSLAAVCVMILQKR